MSECAGKAEASKHIQKMPANGDRVCVGGEVREVGRHFQGLFVCGYCCGYLAIRDSMRQYVCVCVWVCVSVVIV